MMWLLIVVLIISEVFAFIYLHPYSWADHVSFLFGFIGILSLLYITIYYHKQGIRVGNPVID